LVTGALVGVRSFKPGKKKNPRNFIRHNFLFPFNQAMTSLEGTNPTILLLKIDANDDKIFNERKEFNKELVKA
jgi:hypothetical protein